MQTNFVEELREWIGKTGSSARAVSLLAGNDPDLVRSILRGRVPGDRVMARLRRVMDAHPDGVGHRIVRNPAREPVQRDRVKVEPIAIARDPCIYCGVRGDVGCEHRRPGEQQAKLSGQPGRFFVR